MEDGTTEEYVEKEDTSDIVSRYDDYRGDRQASWHTPTYTAALAFNSPDYRPASRADSPVYCPDDYSVWSAVGCTAGNGERFDPCHRSTLNVAQVWTMFL